MFVSGGEDRPVVGCAFRSEVPQGSMFVSGGEDRPVVGCAFWAEASGAEMTSFYGSVRNYRTLSAVELWDKYMAFRRKRNGNG